MSGLSDRGGHPSSGSLDSLHDWELVESPSLKPSSHTAVTVAQPARCAVAAPNANPRYPSVAHELAAAAGEQPALGLSPEYDVSDDDSVTDAESGADAVGDAYASASGPDDSGDDSDDASGSDSGELGGDGASDDDDGATSAGGSASDVSGVYMAGSASGGGSSSEDDVCSDSSDSEDDDSDDDTPGDGGDIEARFQCDVATSAFQGAGSGAGAGAGAGADAGAGAGAGSTHGSNVDTTGAGTVQPEALESPDDVPSRVRSGLPAWSDAWLTHPMPRSCSARRFVTVQRHGLNTELGRKTAATMMAMLMKNCALTCHRQSCLTTSSYGWR